MSTQILRKIINKKFFFKPKSLGSFAPTRGFATVPLDCTKLLSSPETGIVPKTLNLGYIRLRKVCDLPQAVRTRREVVQLSRVRGKGRTTRAVPGRRLLRRASREEWQYSGLRTPADPSHNICHCLTSISTTFITVSRPHFSKFHVVDLYPQSFMQNLRYARSGVS